MLQSARFCINRPLDNMKDLVRLSNEPYKLIQQAQLDYDRETNHGSNLFFQKIWNRKIREELKKTGNVFLKTGPDQAKK